MIDLSILSPPQRDAATHGTGPCLVWAGAGSGKTRVAAMRAALLIEEGVPAGRIFFATFTKKAAEEMRERVTQYVGESAKPMWVGTFHSLCLRMLKISRAEQGLPDFKVIDEYQAARISWEVLAKMGWETHVRVPLGYISRAKSDLVQPDSAEGYLQQTTDLTEETVLRVVDFWTRYEEAKDKQDDHHKVSFDFDDLLLKMSVMLKTSEPTRERWQTRFDFVLVDELQDNNHAQHEIARLLCEQHRNYFGVGDSQQKIYSWRGAAIMPFAQLYPDGRIIKLETNYRCQAAILRTANNLIGHNGEQDVLHARAHRPRGEDPELVIAPSENSEAQQVALKVIEQRKAGADYKDIAVLYRVNAQSRAIEDALILRDIPYVVNGSKGFYSQAEILEVMGFIQLAHEPHCKAGDDALEHVINIASSGFGEDTHRLGDRFIASLKRIAAANKCSLLEALDKGAWTDAQWRGIEDFKDYVSAVKHSRNAASAARQNESQSMIETVLGYGLRARLERTTDSEDNPRLDNIDQLIECAEEHPTPGRLIMHVAKQQSRSRKLVEGQDAVQLLTVHRAKGLEFKHVHLIGLAHGLLPHKRSISYGPDGLIDPESIAEERRLAYVAVTRPHDTLSVYAPLSYQHKATEISLFISEMGLSLPTSKDGGM